MTPFFLLLLAASPTEADALFDQAREAMARKDYAVACPLLRQSYAAEPALGTLLNLAECEEKQGLTASAWLRFNEAAGWAARNKEQKREAYAAKRAAELKPALQYLAIESEAFPASAKLQLDEAEPIELPGRLSIPVDPGPHHCLVSAPGFDPQHAGFMFDTPGASQTWKLRFVAEAKLQPPAPAPALAPTVPPPSPAPAPGSEPLVVQESKRIPAVVVGTGAVLVTAGLAGLSYSVIRHQAFARQQVGGPDQNHPSVTRGELTTMQTVYPTSWVLAATGTAVFAGGLYMLLRKPPGGSPQLAFVPGERGATLFVHGSF
jgi:hypothetical protein